MSVVVGFWANINNNSKNLNSLSNAGVYKIHNLDCNKLYIQLVEIWTKEFMNIKKILKQATQQVP